MLFPKKDYAVDAISALLLVVFVYTGVSKLLQLLSFRAVLSQSPLIGEFAGLIGWLLPIAELLIAVLLFWPKHQRFGFLASAVLLSLFTVYVGYMLLFAFKLPCACGGILNGLGWKAHLLVNLVLSLTAWYGWKSADTVKKSSTANYTLA